MLYLCIAFEEKYVAKVAQLVEHDLAKVGVAGSNPVFRSIWPSIEGFSIFARVVELVDTQDLKSCSRRGCAGSSPAPGTL
jgi:hypothetical protein